MDIEQRAEALAREPAGNPLEFEPDRLDVSVAISNRTASPLGESLRRLRRDRRAMLAVYVIGFLLLSAIIVPLVYQHIGATLVEKHGFLHVAPADYHGPAFIDYNYTDQGPTALHWLGTDFLGRDLLARLLAGIQVSFLVALLVVGVLDVGLGVLFGVLAGYYGGIIDTLLARFTDLIFAFPGLLLAVFATALFGARASELAGNNGRLILVSLTLGLTVWPQMARYVRGQTLQLKEQQFVEAARTVGTSSRQIITRHIIPNIASLIVVAATLDISGAIINEGVLSLLGLGVQPPGSSLGVMISDSLSNIAAHPYEALLPALTLTILVLSLSFLGDGMRDAFDPRSKD